MAGAAATPLTPDTKVDGRRDRFGPEATKVRRINFGEAGRFFLPMDRRSSLITESSGSGLSPNQYFEAAANTFKSDRGEFESN
jgi:hypothetical protein